MEIKNNNNNRKSNGNSNSNNKKYYNNFIFLWQKIQAVELRFINLDIKQLFLTGNNNFNNRTKTISIISYRIALCDLKRNTV